MRSSAVDSKHGRHQCSRGILVLIVGPSGAGKDSIIRGAAERLRHEPRFVFARRAITRPADAGGEDHIPVSVEEFARLRNNGEFLLHWEAHGKGYGLPQEFATALASGLWVIANVSRSVVAEARRSCAPVLVISVTAPPAVLAERLAARGRENEEETRGRLERATAIPLAHPDLTISNDRPLELAVELFTLFLKERLDQAVRR